MRCGSLNTALHHPHACSAVCCSINSRCSCYTTTLRWCLQALWLLMWLLLQVLLEVDELGLPLIQCCTAALRPVQHATCCGSSMLSITTWL